MATVTARFTASAVCKFHKPFCFKKLYLYPYSLPSWLCEFGRRFLMQCLAKPELIDAQQIEKCQRCRNASGKKIWCCKFGFYFIEPQKREIIYPPSTLLVGEEPIIPKAKPTIFQMAADFTKAMIRWGKSGMACVSKDQYIKRRSICNECTGGWRCPHCGCMLWAKVALVTERCPEGKGDLTYKRL